VERWPNVQGSEEEAQGGSALEIQGSKKLRGGGTGED